MLVYTGVGYKVFVVLGWGRT